MLFMAWFTLVLSTIRVMADIVNIFKNKKAGVNFVSMCIEAIPIIFIMRFLMG